MIIFNNRDLVATVRIVFFLNFYSLGLSFFPCLLFPVEEDCYQLQTKLSLSYFKNKESQSKRKRSVIVTFNFTNTIAENN